MPNGAGWVVAWRLAPLGGICTAAAAAATFSIHHDVITIVMDPYRGVTDEAAISAVRSIDR